jgi:hypothetical protein
VRLDTPPVDLPNYLSGPQLHGGARFQAAAEQIADDVTVRATDDPVFLDESVRSLAGALGEPVVELHRQPAGLGERLDRLDTAGERARDDSSQLERTEQLEELQRLAAATRVQGP